MADLTKKESVTTATNSRNIRDDSTCTTVKSQQNSTFGSLEPWAEPVDGIQLVQELRDTFQRYLVLPDGALSVLPLWVLHTYSVDSFYYTPRLCIYSPVPRCGKTQLLQLLEMTTYNPLNTSGITAAGIFRAIDYMRPTLLIDEADCYLNDDAAIRNVINAGYKKGGKIVRNNIDSKKGYVPKIFNCYSAMAIAGIGMRDTTIMDRSIIILMNRRKPSDMIEKLRQNAILSDTERLRSMCLRFMNDNASAISETHPDMPSFLNDRSADIWEPLFSIATFISQDLVAELTAAASRLIPLDDDGDDIGIQLLSDIYEMFEETRLDFVPTNIIVGRLRKLENRPWGEIQYGRPMLTDIKLARLLKIFQIKPIQKRQGNKLCRGYEILSFQYAFEHYLSVTNCDSVTPKGTPVLPCHDVTDTPETPSANTDLPVVDLKDLDESYFP